MCVNKIYKSAVSIVALLLVLLCSTSIVSAQLRIVDSLKVVLHTAKDTAKAKVLSDLCWEYRNISVDSAILYGMRAIEYSRTKKYELQLAQALNDIGIIYSDKADYEHALQVYTESFSIRKQFSDSMGMASLYLKIGIAYQKKGNLNLALKNQLSALSLYESLDFKKGISYCLNNIALIHYNMGNNEKSLEYHQKSFDLKQSQNDQYGMAGSLVNMGNIYFEQKNYARTIEVQTLALAMLRKIGDREYLSACLNNLGSAYIQTGQNNLALPYIKEALELRKAEMDKKGMLSSYINLANVYYNLKQFAQSEIAFDEALQLSLKTNALAEQEMLYKNLAQVAEKSGKYKDALDYLNQYIVLHDSLLNNHLNTEVADMQTKYESDKKEKENLLLKSENALKELAIAEQKSRQTILVTVLVLLVLSSFFVIYFIRYRNQLKLSDTLLQQEKIRLHEVLQTQELERKRISAELHDGVGQMMAAVRMRVSALEEYVDKTHQTDFENTLLLIDKSCTELRQISHELMPSILVKTGLTGALKELESFYNKSNGTALIIDVSGLQQRPGEIVEINMYRVLQELIGNAMKYAQATEIQVQVFNNETALTIMVEDNGQGFEKEKLIASTGNGWHNIESRVALLKGILELDTKPGKGTAVFIEVPLKG